jgi:predicted RNA polymerase sigma factor
MLNSPPLDLIRCFARLMRWATVASGTRNARAISQAERSERLVAVLEVLYLIFNEGYTASSGSALHRIELTSEAIRLTRQLRERLPDDGEVAGLLALMLLTDARRPARTRPDGALVPLAEQDRNQCDAQAIAEGGSLDHREYALYSTPSTTCPPGTKLEARCDRELVKLYRAGALVKLHPR